MAEETKFKISISSEHKLFDLHIKETFQYRDLIFLFVKRDFTALYKQTILGPAWAIVQPLLTTVVFTIIFGNLAHLTTKWWVTNENITENGMYGQEVISFPSLGMGAAIQSYGADSGAVAAWIRDQFF